VKYDHDIILLILIVISFDIFKNSRLKIIYFIRIEPYDRMCIKNTIGAVPTFYSNMEL